MKMSGGSQVFSFKHNDLVTIHEPTVIKYLTVIGRIYMKYEGDFAQTLSKASSFVTKSLQSGFPTSLTASQLVR